MIEFLEISQKSCYRFSDYIFPLKKTISLSAKKSTWKKKWLQKIKKIRFERSHISTQALRWVSVFVFGSALLVAVFLVWGKITEPPPFAEILSKERTIAFVEIHPTSDMVLDANSPLKKFDWEAELHKYFGESGKLEHLGWVGSKLGVTFVKSHSKETLYETLLLVAVSKQQKAIQFLESLTLPDETLKKEKKGNITIFSFPKSHDWKCAFFTKYLVCGFSEESVLSLVSESMDPLVTKVNTTEEYLKIQNNLPKKSHAFWYFSPELLKGTMTPISENFLQNILRSVGGTIQMMDDDIQLQSYVFLQKGEYQKPLLLPPKERLQMVENITSPDSIILLLTGYDFSTHFQQALTLIETMYPTGRIIVEGVLNGVIKEYFGDSVSLEKDFLPLFAKEWVFLVRQESDHIIPHFELVIENDSELAPMITKIFDAFEKRSARFAPEVRTHTLEDGTVVKEVVADESKVTRTEEMFHDSPLFSLQIAELPYGFHYNISEDLVVFSTNEDIVKNEKKGKDLMKNTSEYESLKKAFVVPGDELGILKISKVSPFLTSSISHPFLIKFLSKLESLGWQIRWWDDAVRIESILFWKQ